MKIVENKKTIDRGAKIGRYTFFASLIIFGIGLYVSFTQKDSTDTTVLIWTMGALIVGFILSQISISYQNRFGRSPKPYEQITAALKGMGEKYTLFHYAGPVAHMLIGPTGVWAIVPFNQSGRIVFENGKWKHKGGSWLQKLFGGDNLGKPDLDADANLRDVQKSIATIFDSDPLPPAKVILLFLNPRAELEAEESPYPAVTLKKIKDTLRKIDKTELMSDEQTREVTRTYINLFEGK